MNFNWIGLVTLIPILLLSMAAHELSHGWTAYKLGDPTAKRAGRLTLNPLKHLDPLGTAMFFITYIFSGWLFGWAKPIPVSPWYFRNRQRGMALVGAAGPAANFTIAIVLILLLNWTHPDPYGTVFDIVFLAFQVNVVLGLFNLIPIPPLDGSRVVGAVLPREAYEKWVGLDRFGMIIVLLVVILFQRQFSQLIRWAVLGLANLFLGYVTLV